MKKLLIVLGFLIPFLLQAQRVDVNVNVTVNPDSTVFKKRISYPFNLGSTFSQFTLVDKNYVDSLVLAAIAGGSFTFSNGIIESGGSVKLGGRLTTATNISGRFLYDLYLDSMTTFKVKTSGDLFFYHNTVSWLMLLGGTPQMIYPDGTGNVAISLSSTGASILGGSGSSITVALDSSRVTKRISYSTNLASTFTLYSLVTKRYVDSSIAAGGGGGMVYPGAGIPLSNGTAWLTSITDNSANWNTAVGWGNHAGLYPTITRFNDSLTAHVDRLDTTRNGIRGDLNGKLNTGLSFLLSDTSAKTWAFTDITGVPSYLLASDTAAKTWDWADITGKPAYWLISDTAAKTWAWTDITGAPSFLTSYTETDPIVKAINGLIKSNGTVISAAVAGTDYLTPSGSAAALTSFPTFNQNTTGSAATLTTTRTLWGQNFNGSANVTGDITLGINSITMTGSLAATGARVTKGWFSDGEFTNMPSVGGTSLTTVAQTLQNKTITNSNNVLGGVTMTLGSDASWDLYTRNASGILERIGNGTTGQFLGANTGAKPTWQTPAGGGGITVGTTTITGGTDTYVLTNNAGVVGEMAANFTNYTGLANKDLLWYNSTTSEWNNITVATLKTEIGIFGSAINGLVPLSGGGTTNFLRADGTWAAPSGGGTYTGSGSIVLTGSDFTLVNDNATPGNNYVYSTNSSGTKAWQPATVTNFTSLANKDLMWYNSATAEWNNITIPILATNMQLYKLPYDPAPTAAGADTLKVFNYKVGGRNMLGTIDPDGIDNAAQYHLARNGVAMWLPIGNGTAITTIRTAALSATGTATAANYAQTNRYTQMKKVEYLVTVAATTAVAGFREGTNLYMRGSNAGDGGFHYICRFGPATGVATTTNRCFVGMSTTTAAPTDVEPSTLLNMIGFGWDAADANIQFFNNDGSGTATKTSTGIAVPTADRTSVYEVSMYCKPTGTTIYYTIKDLVSGSSFSSFVTTDIPGATTGLSPRGWMSVGGTSSVIGIALMSLSMESDF